MSTACANPASNARNPNLTLSRSEEPRAENQQSLEFPPRSHVCGYSTRTRAHTESPAALLGCDRVLGAAAGLRTAPAQHRGARRGGERRRGSRRLLQDCAGGCLRAARSISPARRPRSPGAAGPPPAQGRGGEARPARRAARQPRPPEGRAGRRRRRWERAAGSARERRRRRRGEGGIEQSAAQAARRRGCQPREEPPPPPPPDSTITSHGEGKGPAMRSPTRSHPATPRGCRSPPRASGNQSSLGPTAAQSPPGVPPHPHLSGQPRVGVRVLAELEWGSLRTQFPHWRDGGFRVPMCPAAHVQVAHQSEVHFLREGEEPAQLSP